MESLRAIALLVLFSSGILAESPQVQWKPGAIETSTYRHTESGVPGTTTYTVSGILYDGRRAFEIAVRTQRKLVLGGQEGKLETQGSTIVDAATLDLLDSRLTTLLNGAEASSLRAERKGGKIRVIQRLRGSPTDTRTVDAPDPVVEDSALFLYLSNLPWKQGQEFRWLKFSPAQGRLLHAIARVEAQEKEVLRVAVQTEIGSTTYQLRRGRPALVLKVEAGGGERTQLETSSLLPRPPGR